MICICIELCSLQSAFMCIISLDRSLVSDTVSGTEYVFHKYLVRAWVSLKVILSLDLVIISIVGI